MLLWFLGGKWLNLRWLQLYLVALWMLKQPPKKSLITRPEQHFRKHTLCLDVILVQRKRILINYTFNNVVHLTSQCTTGVFPGRNFRIPMPNLIIRNELFKKRG